MDLPLVVSMRPPRTNCLGGLMKQERDFFFHQKIPSGIAGVIKYTPICTRCERYHTVSP